MEKDSKIYIAGHDGLVGSSIVKILKNKGYHNFLFRHYTKLDLTDQKATQQFFGEEKPDYVFLAAAKVGGIFANNTYRAQFIYENIMIQSNIIHASYFNNVKKLLFLGSTCIYPKLAPQPMKEDALLTDFLEYTNEPYAIAKIAGIKMCESYNLQYGTNYISVMPTNLYGYNDNFNLENSHVLPALIRKNHLCKCLENDNFDAIRKDLGKYQSSLNSSASNDEIITYLEKSGIKRVKQNDKFKVELHVWGTGSPFREFLWAEEMADACVFLMENIDFKDLIEVSNIKNNEIRNTHVNIGSGKEIRIKDLAYLVKEIIGFKGEIKFDLTKPDGTPRKLTDPGKLHALGWRHKIELEEGIKLVYEHYIK
ncbi:MAG: GDP-L-fucose synthase [Bacteroidetes bacterium]|nr:GDP-L-fucose synthase [Bacteroidota bacterium]MBL7104905.1 GDP-L-fucose synthase [Bacteroidales bacterium]